MQRSLPLPAGCLGERCKVPGQSLGGGPGAEPTEAPKIQEFLTVKMGENHNNVNGNRHNNVIV